MRLLNIFKKYINKQRPENNISANELISRFIFSKRYFSRENSVVKYSAFLPNPKNNKTSVYRVSNLSDTDIWSIGKFVSGLSNRNLKARADIYVSMVYKAKLNIKSETSQHILHADIENWPKSLDEQKLLAIELANESKLNLP